MTEAHPGVKGTHSYHMESNDNEKMLDFCTMHQLTIEAPFLKTRISIRQPGDLLMVKPSLRLPHLHFEEMESLTT